MRLEKFAKGAGKIFSSLSSVAKVMIMSKSPFPRGDKKDRPIIIMGNGPSLRKTLDDHRERLLECELMAVNFFANTDDFREIRPRYYILADGHFFNGLHSDPNVRRLWEEMAKVSWEMTLFVPSRYRHLMAALMLDVKCVKLQYFNMTPTEGFRVLNHFLYDAGLAMPRPRNVMIPAIMCAIREGFSKIYLCGADHSWTKTLDVDDENFVISIQPHFYNDNEEERKRVRQTYAGIMLHDVLGSMATAFRSYWDIAPYAKKKGVEIINATPSSMIDAFPRLKS